MSGTIKTVKINGIAYDASTGLPIKSSKITSTKPTSSSNTKTASLKKPVNRGKSIQKKPSRSTTLKRNFVNNKTTARNTKTTAKTKTVRNNTSNKIKVTNIQSKSKPIASSRPETIPVTTVRHPMVTHFPVSHVPVADAPKKELSAKLPTEQDSSAFIDKFDDLLGTIGGEADSIDSSVETNFEIPSTLTQKRSKIAIIITFIITLLSLIGIVIILNLSLIQMFIASARTGVPGVLPSYTVPGFEIANVAVTNELNIEIKYQNNNGQKYSVLQSKTTRPDTMLKINNNQSTATIIKNNILYTIIHNQLDETQIQSIANNL